MKGLNPEDNNIPMNFNNNSNNPYIMMDKIQKLIQQQ
jgi:hypothetical protein